MSGVGRVLRAKHQRQAAEAVLTESVTLTGRYSFMKRVVRESWHAQVNHGAPWQETA